MLTKLERTVLDFEFAVSDYFEFLAQDAEILASDRSNPPLNIHFYNHVHTRNTTYPPPVDPHYQ